MASTKSSTQECAKSAAGNPAPAAAAAPRDLRPFLIREATFADTSEMARIAARAYHNTGLSQVLAPWRDQYPLDHVLGYQRRIQARLLSARNRSFVAVAADEPGVPVAYMQCVRLGDDEGARAVEREKARWWTGAVETVFGWYFKAEAWAWPDRSVSKEGLEEFFRAGAEEDKKHWEGRKDRECRWYAQSVVVAEEFRGRGVGKQMMAKVLERAQAEGVVVGLEASDLGELLYRSVGFEVLGRFMRPFGEEEMDGGGVMMWSPK